MAPPISLPGVSGDRFALAEALQRGPALVAFFKVSCPTCQYTFPFLERISKAYSSQKATLVGISQNEKADTVAFAKQYGISFPLYLDDTKTYPVSNQYGLTHVPTMFLISPEGKVEAASVGWFRPDIEKINAHLARVSGEPRAEIFAPGEDIVDYMAG